MVKHHAYLNNDVGQSPEDASSKTLSKRLSKPRGGEMNMSYAVGKKLKVPKKYEGECKLLLFATVFLAKVIDMTFSTQHSWCL